MRSPVAGQLPGRGVLLAATGERVVEHGRYHLDLRHPAAVRHLDEVDRLPGQRPRRRLPQAGLQHQRRPRAPTPAGAARAPGCSEHNRAHLDWLDAVLDRHPGLIIENCASGGHADGLRPAVPAPAAVHQRPAGLPALRGHRRGGPGRRSTPEQAAVWAYPQPGFTDDEIAFTLCSALLGRIHLSGHLDQMSRTSSRPWSAAAVGGLQAHPAPTWPRPYRSGRSACPAGPTPVLALGMRAPRRHLRAGLAPRPRPASDRPETVTLPVPRLAGAAVHARGAVPGRGRGAGRVGAG